MMRVFIADDEEIIRDGTCNALKRSRNAFCLQVKRRTAKWHCLC